MSNINSIDENLLANLSPIIQNDKEGIQDKNVKIINNFKLSSENNQINLIDLSQELNKTYKGDSPQVLSRKRIRNTSQEYLNSKGFHPEQDLVDRLHKALVLNSCISSDLTQQLLNLLVENSLSLSWLSELLEKSQEFYFRPQIILTLKDHRKMSPSVLRKIMEIAKSTKYASDELIDLIEIYDGLQLDEFAEIINFAITSNIYPETCKSILTKLSSVVFPNSNFEKFKFLWRNEKKLIFKVTK